MNAFPVSWRLWRFINSNVSLNEKDRYFPPALLTTSDMSFDLGGSTRFWIGKCHTLTSTLSSCNANLLFLSYISICFHSFWPRPVGVAQSSVKELSKNQLTTLKDYLTKKYPLSKFGKQKSLSSCHRMFHVLKYLHCAKSCTGQENQMFQFPKSVQQNLVAICRLVLFAEQWCIRQWEHTSRFTSRSVGGSFTTSSLVSSLIHCPSKSKRVERNC